MACSTSYQPNPIDSQANVTAIENQHAQSIAFSDFVKQQPRSAWPIEAWNLQTLTYSALFHHKDLEVTKAEYAVALAGITTAGARPYWELNGLLAKSNQANGDLKPWSYGMQINIPIVTNNKKTIKLEQAQHEADIAKIKMAETAWQLRQQLAQDIIDESELSAQIESATLVLNAQKALIDAYQHRFEAGYIGKSELTLLNIHYQNSVNERLQAQNKLTDIRVKIANDAGLTWSSFQPKRIEKLNVDEKLSQHQPKLNLANAEKNIQSMALQNRMDIQRGLAKYALAESKLKLEFAKLIPDISLTPGIDFDYGDRVWSLGIGSLLNVLNRPANLTISAEKLRDLEAAQFNRLQSQIIFECNQRYVSYQQASKMLSQMQENARLHQAVLANLKKQWQAGLIDKTAWLNTQLEMEIEARRIVTQKYTVLRAMQAIEDLVQKPLES